MPKAPTASDVPGSGLAKNAAEEKEKRKKKNEDALKDAMSVFKPQYEDVNTEQKGKPRSRHDGY